MPRATVLFNNPQQEIAPRIIQKFQTATHIRIAVGFITAQGVRALQEGLASNPQVLNSLVIGAGTYQTFEALDLLIDSGVPQDCLFVHLGHTRLTSSKNASHRFLRYHPMLHSKIYYMEHADGSASAIIGSHNMTYFALCGQNGEAAVLLEGSRELEEFCKIRNHIDVAEREARLYDPDLKESFAWWTHQYIEGFSQNVNDLPKDGDSSVRTIIILAESETGEIPANGQIIYFELPSAITEIRSLSLEIHIFIFDILPSSPSNGLACLDQAKASVWCQTQGVEKDRGGEQLKAHWKIENYRNPVLYKLDPPVVNPNPPEGMQQVRVKAHSSVRDKFKYFFNFRKRSWIPELDNKKTLEVNPRHDYMFTEADQNAKYERVEWYLVKDLRCEELGETERERALKMMSPEDGSYIMLSSRRQQTNLEAQNNRRQTNNRQARKKTNYRRGR